MKGITQPDMGPAMRPRMTQNKGLSKVLRDLISALDAALDQISRDSEIIPEDDADKSHRLTTVNLGKMAIANAKPIIKKEPVA